MLKELKIHIRYKITDSTDVKLLLEQERNQSQWAKPLNKLYNDRNTKYFLYAVVL